jgi:hypothetical protein
MKIIPQLPTYLIAALYLFSAFMFFFPLMEMPAMTGNQAVFFNLFVTTGYMAVIKIIEIIGAVLLLVPSKRALGSLILAPIVVNIFLFEILIVKEMGPGVAMIILQGIILYQERAKLNVF